MAWEHLSINRPHLVYIILGGFTTLFMLCSSVIKERLYIGEATVATLCGIIFGPHAADLIDPHTWGNTDQITLEFSRIVLVVQCFAVGVELPKAYMERHWKSVTFLLIPVMTFGWLITSLFIWALFGAHLNWLDSLCIAACVTATDPVLASSVVGKGKFAKRVPKHLRDLLSAESGCNDGMAFPFIYLAVYVIRYKGHPNEVSLHWFCYTILYECVFGAIFGVTIGYIARRAVRAAHERDMIDRESFLVFYFVLALFCAGAGSLLGADDLLIGFAAGVGFSNDGWFTEKTEESHVSNVIDLLINLAFFVYFGTIVPWEQFNSHQLSLDVWRLVVLALLVLFFRRIPIMLALKPLIPDIKTWREALFAGHFGPIGVGAIFVAILARAELESEHGSTTPLAELPPADFPHDNIIELIWPITTFLVITSIVVHGSSIAVFTLGKHINTLTLTMSYTQANDQGPSWMERLPRIQSRSKSSMSLSRYDTDADEKEKAMSPDNLQPGTFLRRQKEGDGPYSRASSGHRSRRSRNLGVGGPISQSAIHPTRREDAGIPSSRSDSDTIAAKTESPSSLNEKDKNEAAEIYEEGDQTVYEDSEGNVLAVEDTREGQTPRERTEFEVQESRRLMHQEGADENHGVAPTHDDPHDDTAQAAKREANKVGEEAKETVQGSGKPKRQGLSTMGTLNKIGTLAGMKKKDKNDEEKPKAESKRAQGPARAYQYGNTIIVEDEDGEVIKKYDIGPNAGKQGTGPADPERSKQSVGRMGKMLGLGHGKSEATAEQPTGGDGTTRPKPERRRTFKNTDDNDDEGDDLVRFTVSDGPSGGRRMSKAEFIDKIRKMDPKARAQVVENSDVPESVKREARKEAREQAALQQGSTATVPVVAEQPAAEASAEGYFPNTKESRSPSAGLVRAASHEDTELKLVDSNSQEVPVHNVSASVRDHTSSQSGRGETAAERRRRLAAEAAKQQQDEDSEDDGTERVPPRATGNKSSANDYNDAGETAAEKRRRKGALGVSAQYESDSEDDNGNDNVGSAVVSPATEQVQRQSTLKWGKNVKG